MQGNNRSLRVRANVSEDQYVNVKLDSDVGIIELLSLKIDTSNFYKIHSANYGCIAGRVLANGGVGVPNAKISAFISIDNTDVDDPILSSLYPYTYVYSKNNNNIRYNLLPEEQVSQCHTPIGTFPSKRMVLDDDNVIEIFDKYYKFTTRSNDAGDYMLFGLPVGEQNIHVDIDLSDIGVLSQRPRDMMYKGYDSTQFENANKFKSDVNLNNLSQIITQDTSVNVYPFWGNTDENEIKITRNDIDVQYKFEPTCIFLGSLITDEQSQGITKKCIATDRMGKMDRLTTGIGTIEMIRKTPYGTVEEKQIQGNQLIDGNGTWCYQIPMNLDYYMTDEYGNFVPSDDKEKGIPTRTRARFRVSLMDFKSEFANNHVAKVLVPNNPRSASDIDYHFGSETLDSEDGTKSFRDLFWNNIYTVKQYIPRIQKGNNNRNLNFTGFKNINENGANNPIPYNNIRINLTFMFALQCAILKGIIRILTFINKLDTGGSSDKTCSALGDGVCPDLVNWYFAPGCPQDKLATTLSTIRERDGDDVASIDVDNRDANPGDSYCITSKTKYLMQCVEITLAMEYNVIQFDFYNDWINGMIYVPRWFVNIRKKKRYFFGKLRETTKTEACIDSTFGGWRRFVQQCALWYNNDGSGNFTEIDTSKQTVGCSRGPSYVRFWRYTNRQKCHLAYGRKHAWVRGGMVHPQTTMHNQNVYYFRPAEWLNINNNNYATKCNLFATDVVLLGSLNDCDENGIPQVFEELVSSTYLMPSNLAVTNMDSTAYMYSQGGEGTVCAGQNAYKEQLYYDSSKRALVASDSALEVVDQTFPKFVEWSKNADYYEPDPDDDVEYAVTESAGIDWGYAGPRQGSNDLGRLYFPGGHFLGLSCFNAETNIKSCVNLSRICEIGSIMSQRQPFLRKDGNSFKNDYLIPNGFISKAEITDSNFRRVFATLNYNGLKTKIDDITQYPRYELKYLHPTGFIGELKNVINQQSAPYYMDFTDDETGEKDSTTMAYRRVLEDRSLDYYYFRMGFADIEDKSNFEQLKKNSYLVIDGNYAALPMYENSFYFYFGLSDGNTAIDRFFKDFYAPCKSDDEDASYFGIDTVYTEGCAGSSETTIKVSNVEPPYTIVLYKQINNALTKLYLHLREDGNIEVSTTSGDNYSDTLQHNFSTFKFVGLSSGTYTMEMKAKDMEKVSGSFIIEDTLGSQVGNIGIIVNDFTFASYDEKTNLTNTYGSVTFTNVNDESMYGIFLATDEKYIFKQIGDFPFSSFKASMNNYVDVDTLIEIDSTYVTKTKNGELYDYKFPAWRGNDTYYAYAIYSCEGNTIITQLSTQTVMMATGLDVYFGDADFSYKANSSLVTTKDWINTVLGDTKHTKYTMKQQWNLKQTLFYKGSMYNSIPNGALSVIPINSSGNYDELITGYGERYTTSMVDGRTQIHFGITDTTYTNKNIGTTDGYGLGILSFLFPTAYFGTDGKVKKFTSYEKGGYPSGTTYNAVTVPQSVKSDYLYKVTDSKESTNSIYLPSIYRPCYITGVMLIDETKKVKTYAATVVNAVTYNNKVSNVKFNGTAMNDGAHLTFLENFNGDCIQTKLFTSTMSESSNYGTGDESFIFSFKEGAPSGNMSGGIGAATYTVNNACHFPCNEADGDWYYTEGVKFYYCSRVDNNVSVGGTIINDGENNIEMSGSTCNLIVDNVVEDTIVKVFFKRIYSGERYVMTNINTINALKSSRVINSGHIDAVGMTVFDTISTELKDTNPLYISSGECIIFDMNSGDKISMTANVEYNILSVNDDGVIRTVQKKVGISTDTDGKRKTVTKNLTVSVSGKAIVWWDPNEFPSDGITNEFTIKYDNGGKFQCGITKNTSLILFSGKSNVPSTLYVNYVEVNGSIVLACKINDVQEKPKTTSGTETYDYVNNITYGKVPKDYSDPNTSFWNGIFGNAEFKLTEVSEQLTIAKITARANKIGSSMWNGFRDIIANDIKQNIFAISDDWTKLGTGVRTGEEGSTENFKKYTSDITHIWDYVTPDTNTMAIVKYYPKDI